MDRVLINVTRDELVSMQTAIIVEMIERLVHFFAGV